LDSGFWKRSFDPKKSPEFVQDHLLLLLLLLMFGNLQF
jgi:hypothetical protein